jgi:hypothetical protein
MKTFILCVLLSIGLSPQFGTKGFKLTFGSSAHAQTYGSETDPWGGNVITGGYLPDEEGASYTQSGEFCAATTMSYIGDFLGMNLNPSDIMMDFVHNDATAYANMLGSGVPFNQIDALVGSAFDYTVLHDASLNPDSEPGMELMYGALDNGHPLMGTFRNENGMLHDVMVVGYDDESGLVRVLDPGDGQYSYQDPSSYVKVIEINGPKPTTEYFPVYP